LILVLFLADPVQAGLSISSLRLFSIFLHSTPRWRKEKNMAALHSTSARPIHFCPATRPSYRRRRLCLLASAVSSAPKARFIARRSESKSVKQLQRPLGTSFNQVPITNLLFLIMISHGVLLSIICGKSFT
jgi:hypothetical protein